MQNFSPYFSEYTHRIPTPPRIVVPPATVDTRLLTLQPGFLGFSTATEQHPAPDWEYDYRRTAQAVLPLLFLGPATVTRDAEFFRTHGITLVLCVGSTLVKITDAVLQRVRSMGVEAQSVHTTNDSSTIRAFPTATAIVQEHMARLNTQNQVGKVLVCCESGSDRSASVAAALLMETYQNADHITAIRIVQTRRLCATFDENSKRMLQSYWDILTAQRTVAAADDSHERVQANLKKRQLSEDTDGQSDDMMVEAERKQYTPFDTEY